MKPFSNKNLMPILAAGSLFFIISACEEVGPAINFIETTYTTYIETPETPQDKVVLIEDFTGAACPNCPDGHIAVADVIANYPNKIIAIAEYNFPSDPLYIEQNMVTSESLDLNGYLGPVSAWPAIFIDRKDFGADGDLEELPANVAASAAEQVTLTAPVNLYIENTFDNVSRTLTVSVKVKYTSTVILPNNLSIVLTESNIIAAQIDDNAGGEVEDYVHNHVLRKTLTFFSGDALPEENVAGRVYEFEYTYALPANWNADNMYAIAFVHNFEADNKEILQSTEREIVD